MDKNEVTVTLTAEAVETILKLLLRRIDDLEYGTEWLNKRLAEVEKQKEVQE